MRIKYPKAIQESEEELTRLEQRLRGQKAADRVRVITWSESGAPATRTGSRCGGSSRNIGSSGRPGADDTRKPMQSNRQPLKKLREPGQASSAQACRGLG